MAAAKNQVVKAAADAASNGNGADVVETVEHISENAKKLSGLLSNTGQGFLGLAVAAAAAGWSLTKFRQSFTGGGE